MINLSDLSFNDIIKTIISDYAVFFSQFSDDSLPYFSTVVAHEMGHNLGMNHDDDRCKSESYIMGSTAR